MSEPVIITRVKPQGSRTTRVTLEGASCALCGRPFKLGDRARVDKGRLVHPKDVPCVPAWVTA